MAKKRSCRRTEQERANHEKAVAFRKMTDNQIVSCLEQQYNNGFNAGLEIAKTRIAELEKELQEARETANLEQIPLNTKSPNEILAAISAIRGVGETILSQIKKALYG